MDLPHSPPDPKRPRLLSDPRSAGGAHQPVSLLHPSSHSPTSGLVSYQASPQQPQPPPPPPSAAQYPQPLHFHPFPFPRPLLDQHHPLLPSQGPPPPVPLLSPASQSLGLDDRRRHEPERYPLLRQEHRPPHTLSPIPPPPLFSSFAPRDPMLKAETAVKSDSGDETMSHMQRPNPTGAPTAAPPDAMSSAMSSSAMSSATPQPANTSLPYADDKSSMGFDQAVPPSGVYRQPSYPPATPSLLQQSQSFDYSSYATNPQPADTSLTLHMAAAGKRKAQRASQACDNCRALKAKCDEMKPCKSCKEKKIECRYREAVPKQQDKVAVEILDNMLFLRKQFADFDQRMTNIEVKLDLRPPLRFDTEPSRPGPSCFASAAMPMPMPPPLPEQPCRRPGELTYRARMRVPEMNTAEAQQIVRAMEQETETEPGPYVRPGNPAIPFNHTTLASFMLKWRSIACLVKPILERENIRYIDEFPLRQEEKRGILRVWGRGEGNDGAGVDRFTPQDQAASAADVREGHADSGGGSPADCWGGYWGRIGGGSPGPVDAKSSAAAATPAMPTTLPMPALNLDTQHVWCLVAEYEVCIQRMHPLIPPLDLHAMVHLFLSEMEPFLDGHPDSKPPIAKFVPSLSAADLAVTGKRKRTTSPGPDGLGAEPVSPAKQPAWPVFQRTINNAVVLLILALGRVCLYKGGKIPDVVPSGSGPAEPMHGSPMVRGGLPASPGQGSTPSSYTPFSHSSGQPSPQDASRSRRTSVQGGGGGGGAFAPPRGAVSLKRNLDVIPGLDYFAYATDILGGQLSGSSLLHVYAWILAGLYHGQLGRVTESYTHIRHAGVILHGKMRGKLGHFQNIAPTGIQDPQDNLILFAFWTILQLESDIVAELPLAPSQILQYGDVMPYPNSNIAAQHGFEGQVIQSYMAQLYTRKRLNEIHSSFYNPEEAHPTGLPKPQDVAQMQSLLLDKRAVPHEFQFDPNEPPARDLLSARLRAKHWSARVITYRPFLRYIVETNVGRAQPIPYDGLSPDGRYPLQGDRDYAMPEILAYARKGIKALVESTRAFHGLGDERLIVTNVFGTAHAQWGNLLTLSAVFRDPTLHSDIDEGLLRHLFTKTIAFLRMHAQPSSALMIDVKILLHLEQHLWGKPAEGETMRAPPSFAGHTSAASVLAQARAAAPIPRPFPPRCYGPPW